jgi:hypothetical protein
MNDIIGENAHSICDGPVDRTARRPLLRIVFFRIANAVVASLA